MLLWSPSSSFVNWWSKLIALHTEGGIKRALMFDRIPPETDNEMLTLDVNTNSSKGRYRNGRPYHHAPRSSKLFRGKKTHTQKFKWRKNQCKLCIQMNPRKVVASTFWISNRHTVKIMFRLWNSLYSVSKYLFLICSFRIPGKNNW